MGLAAQEVPTAAIDPPNIKPNNILVQDAPNDNGGALRITWEIPASLPETAERIELLRQRFLEGQPEGEVEIAAQLPPIMMEYNDSGLEDGYSYTYAVRFNGPMGAGPEMWSQLPVKPTAQWFHTAKFYLLMILIFLSGAILISLQMAARGKKFFIRKIAGLDAVEEAVGRATEMGKSVLFIPGIQDLDNVQTVAGLTILGSIARLTAKYEAELHVPVSRSLVMSTARETIKEAYTTEGRPDLYSEEMAHYLTDEQFGYVAAVDGIMVREKPAACFYMGAFFAESLILAETGNSIGAIQIAGTAMPTQLPFFVAACDYTLIGEELFAASVYLSQDARAIGSLRGQDLGKVLAMVAILIGAVFETISRLSDGSGVATTVAEFLKDMFSTTF